MQVDIIGGGLSGLATALSIKKHDPAIDVVVHEKHKKIGFNVDAQRCGEAHYIDAEWMKWKPPSEGISTEIRHAETIIGSKRYVYNQKPDTAWILNRPAYIAWLGDQVQEMGVDIEVQDTIKDVYELSGDVIVDASGCPSKIKKQLGLKKGFIGSGYQQTLHNSSWYVPDTIRIIFDEHVGYFWVFPRNPDKREINIGAGFFNQTTGNLKELLEDFKKKQDITGTIDHVIGGYIPIGLQPPLRYKNTLFVGDAGVGTYPLTGQGIYRAFLSGDAAGKAIALGKITRYPYEMRKLFIKWDVLGKTFLWTNNIVKRINPPLTLRLWNLFFSFIEVAHL